MRQTLGVLAMFAVSTLLTPATAAAFTLTVESSDASPVGSYRWLVEEDNTHPVTPLALVSDSLGVSIHRSHALVVAAGSSADLSPLDGLTPGTRYFLTVMPDSGFTVSGTQLVGGAGSATVTVNPWPVPTAQISVFVFEDDKAISGIAELPAERGLANFSVRISEILGQQSTDVFGNPLGTTYQTDIGGDFVYDVDGNPIPDVIGQGIVTDANGYALIKNLPPGKYNVSASPRDGQPWVQTSSLGGSPQIPVVVKAGEPPLFTQGGILNQHVYIGFVKPFRNLPTGSGTISGRCVEQHSSKPPAAVVFSGAPIKDCWVGLNFVEQGTETGVLVQKAAADGTFTIVDLPPSLYQVTVWDEPLDNVMNVRTLTLAAGQSVDVGDIPLARWVSTVNGSVFRDDNQDGFRDPGEVGIAGQAINLRYKDASIVKATETSEDGTYSIPEVGIFEKYLITEVDFGRFKATGVTATVDQGGNAAPTVETFPGLELLVGTMVHPDQVNTLDWGKAEYGPGPDNVYDTTDDENGGIAGVTVYASTRAENDPRLAAIDDWEPGIPRVQVNLYQDADLDDAIDDVNGDTIATYADHDNYPFQWTDTASPGYTGAPGPEDLDRNYPGQTPGEFDGGDAIQIVTADSFDDNLPTGCNGPPLVIHGNPIQDCAEILANWNQMKIALFDGGYAVDTWIPGGYDTGAPEEPLPTGVYIVEVAPPAGYEIVKEEDVNVLSGDTYSPTPLLLPPRCVGDTRIVPAFLTKDGVTEAPFAGDPRPLCDRKQVTVSRGQNSVLDFHLFTQVPKAGRVVGEVLNAFANQADPNNPGFGGFLTVPWVPVSIRDYNGNEISRVYTDEFGYYNALVPSTINAHVPQPSGYAPNVVEICANQPSSDPQYNPNFDQPCLPLDVMPGKTNYVVTALTAIASFTANTAVDCEFPSGTPVIDQVNGPSGGPWVSATGAQITITSPGTVLGRDFGFGATQGSGGVTVGGTPLTIDSWSDTSIDATIPAGAATGQLVVTRDNGRSTVMGVTLTIEAATPTVVTSGGSIQTALDAASPNDLILVEPGTYAENLIISKPVRLQGYGAWSTTLDASAFAANETDWRAAVEALVTGSDIDTVPGQRLDLANEDGAGITVFAKDGDFTDTPRARVDGFTISGATRGGGVFLNGYARYFEIGNNRFRSNQGMFAGAIRSGWQSLVNDTLTGYTSSFNENLHVHHNHFDKNGSLGDGGAIALYNGSHAYAFTDNYLCGGYSSLNGAGLSHFGLNHEAVIARNQFLFNEALGEGGAIAVTSEFVPAGAPPGLLSEGSGSILIDSNLMQGNYAGDDGGGITVYGLNGLDVAVHPADPTEWYRIDIVNNQIVNNLSGFSAAGIATSEAVNIRIVHNTIANNDSTSLGNFGPGNSQVTQAVGSGVVVRGNSTELTAASGLAFGSPLLVSNVIWHNRSFIWDANENGGQGGLLPDPTSPYWDLQVFGQPAGSGLDPRSCILSEDADGPGGDPHDPTVVYDPSNIGADPLFVDDYVNTITIPPGSLVPNFTPLAPTGSYALGGGSPAIDSGDPGVSGAFGTELETDFYAEPRPSGAGADIGAHEVQAVGGGPDGVGPATRMLSASPNPTAGSASVTVSGIADDTGTGGSTIAGAEWWRDTDPVPAPGGGTAFTGSFTSSYQIISTSVPVPGAADFTVFVRSRDSAGNWGGMASIRVQFSATAFTDTAGPATANISASPNPTAGAVSVTVTATTHDILTGGSDIAEAEWFTGADPGPGNGTDIPLPVDGAYDSAAENLSATVPTAPVSFTVSVRARDTAGNWGAVATFAVTVTDPGVGSGGPVYVQCPGDADGDAVIDAATTAPYSYPSNARCMHITGGDGFVNMADGRRIYMFGFNDVTGTPPDQVIATGHLAANFPAPRIVADEGDEFYLNLTNVGMLIRPDLFDPHSVHWHGFPQAASIFDGVPEATISINMFNTLTYYYNVIQPGTYMYHCHVEATEHMQMGMLGNLYVRPRQNRLPDDWCFATGQVESPGSCAGHQHSNPDYNANRNLDDPTDGDTYAYNDGDGSTRYDVETAVQIGSFDPDFHDASEGVQALPFALMKDRYPMLNGRGYPDTMVPGDIMNTADEPKPSQKEPTRVEATQGQRILLRISNLNVTRLYTLATLGIPMKVVGYNARLFRSPAGRDLYYGTNSVTLGGGEAVDVLLDTTNVAPGTYYLYTTNLHYLTNNDEQYGGMMTEITITAP